MLLNVDLLNDLLNLLFRLKIRVGLVMVVFVESVIVVDVLRNLVNRFIMYFLIGLYVYKVELFEVLIFLVFIIV